MLPLDESPRPKDLADALGLDLHNNMTELLPDNRDPVASPTPPPGPAGSRAGSAAQGPTFVLGGELLHFGREGLVEALLAGDEGLAHRVVVVAHHAAVAAHLVDEGLQEDPAVPGQTRALAVLPHFHGLTNTHRVGGPLRTGGGGCSSWATAGELGRGPAGGSGVQGSVCAERRGGRESKHRTSRPLGVCSGVGAGPAV